MNYIVSASTDIGNTKQTNQDSYFACVMSTPQGKMAFAVLCDGMGGLAKGELASATVIHAFHDWVQSRLPTLCKGELTDDGIRNEWTDLANSCNERIKSYGKYSGISLGTTITAMLLTPSHYYVMNVGDTRAYEIVDSLNLLTKDQTLVAREVALGILTEEQAAIDPRRSILLQCIGASDSLFPDFFFGATVQNAVYMLCSDGFRHEVSPEEIFRYLQPAMMVSADHMKKNLDTLIELNKRYHERDNITAISIRTF